MKKSQKLFSGFIILAVLLGIYIHAKDVPQESNTDNQAVSIEVVKIDKAKIKQIDIKSAASEFSLSKEGGKWKISGENSELNESVMNSILESLSTINAERLISEASSDLGEYGLDHPDKIITVKLDSGEQKIIEVGAKTLRGYSYYLKIKDISRIYTVSSSYVDDFNITPDSINAGSETSNQDQSNSTN